MLPLTIVSLCFFLTFFFQIHKKKVVTTWNKKFFPLIWNNFIFSHKRFFFSWITLTNLKKDWKKLKIYKKFTRSAFNFLHFLIEDWMKTERIYLCNMLLKRCSCCCYILCCQTFENIHAEKNKHLNFFFFVDFVRKLWIN